MEIKLKNLKINLQFSQETTMFQADLWVDGKKVGYCKNDGIGGNTYITPCTKEDNKKIEEADEYCKTLPEKTVYGYTYKQDLESFVDDMVEDEIEKREEKKFKQKLKRLEKDSLVYTKQKEDEILRSFEQLKFKNVSLEQIVADKRYHLQVKTKINELKRKGYRILNTNIPKDLMGE